MPKKGQNRPEIPAKRLETGRNMPATGRRPYDTTDVTPYATGNARLRPPESLGAPEKQRFIDLIATTPAGQFQPSDLALLCRWAELTVMCEQAQGELAAGGMIGPDGKPSPLVQHLSAKRQGAQRPRLEAEDRSAGESTEGAEENCWAGFLL
jgi:hypothetical protein